MPTEKPNRITVLLLSLAMLLLVVVTLVVVASRAVILWGKENPLVVRQYLNEHLGVDVQYREAKLDTYLNVWHLDVQDVKVHTNTGQLKVDRIRLNLSLFPIFFKAHASSLHLGKVEWQPLPVANASSTEKVDHWRQIDRAATVGAWMNLFHKWALIDVRELTLNDRNTRITLHNLIYSTAKGDSITFQGSGKIGDWNVQGLQSSARMNAKGDWEFNTVIPRLRHLDGLSLENVNIVGHRLTGTKKIHFDAAGELQKAATAERKAWRTTVSHGKNNLVTVHSLVVEDKEIKNIAFTYGQGKVSFQSAHLDLKSAYQILAQFFPKLQPYRVNGQLRWIEAQFDWATQEITYLAFRLQGLELRDQQAKDLNVGKIDVDFSPEGLRLGAQNLHFFVRDLYSQPKTVRSLRAEGTMRTDGFNPPHLHLAPIRVETESGTSMTMSVSVVPTTDSFHIDYRVHSDRVPAEDVKRWLPDGVMNEEGYDWVKSSLSTGSITNFALVLKGPLEEVVDSDHPNHNTHIVFAFEPTIFTPADGWDPIMIRKAHFELKRNVLHIRLDDGKTGDISIRDTTVGLDMTEAIYRVQIKGHGRGSGEAVGRYFDRSPVPEIADLQYLQHHTTLTSGAVDAELAMDLAIEDIDTTPTKVRISMQFTDVDVDLDSHPINAISGTIALDSDTVSSNMLQGQWLGQPVWAKFAKEAGSSTLTIRAGGSLQPSKWLPLVSGESDFSALWQVSLLNGDLELAATSTLEGITSSLPLPLNKARKDVMAITIDARFSTALTTLGASVGNDLAGLQLLRENDTVSGIAWLGGIPEKAHITTGAASLYVQLPVISIDRWQRLHQSLQTSATFISSPSPMSAFSLPKKLEKVHIFTNKLRYKDSVYNDFQLDSEQQGSVTTFQLSSEQAKGQILYDHKTKKLQAELDKWHLNESRSEDCTEIGDAKIRAAEVNIEDWRYADRLRGTLTAQLVFDGGDVSVDRFSLRSDFLQAEGSMHYSSDLSTSLTYKVSSRKLYNLLQAIGLNLRDFSADVVNSDGSISWQGPIHCFDWKSLKGRLFLNTERGVIKNLEPGLGRLLGLLNLDNITRRFSLDIKDVTDPGVGFDRLNASFTFSSGVVTVERLDIDAPALDLHITGSSDMITRTHELRAAVTPKYTKSIVPIYALLGGLPAGLGALAVDQVFNLSGGAEVFTEVYRIRGDWDQPELIKEQE